MGCFVIAIIGALFIGGVFGILTNSVSSAINVVPQLVIIVVLVWAVYIFPAQIGGELFKELKKSYCNGWVYIGIVAFSTLVVAGFWSYCIQGFFPFIPIGWIIANAVVIMLIFVVGGRVISNQKPKRHKR